MLDVAIRIRGAITATGISERDCARLFSVNSSLANDLVKVWGGFTRSFSVTEGNSSGTQEAGALSSRRTARNTRLPCNPSAEALLQDREYPGRQIRRISTSWQLCKRCVHTYQGMAVVREHVRWFAKLPLKAHFFAWASKMSGSKHTKTLPSQKIYSKPSRL